MDKKRHLKKFENISTYESQKDEVMGMPHVVLLEDTKEVVYASENNNEGITFYEMVDLGLPSGIKWANMNVGATSETDFGLFFQWGDTVGYTQAQVENGEKEFSRPNYKWYDGSENTMTKYNDTDGKTELDAEDDGVRVHMGGDWRLPTSTNIEELIANTNYEYTTIDGIEGGKFTNKSDSSKYIFLPGAGYENGYFYLGITFFSWSSSLYDDLINYAQCLDGSTIANFARYSGLPLRGVVG